MPEQTKPRTVEAVQTTLDIIGVLQNRESAGVTELASELGRSKGTIHSHLATLLENEYIAKRDDCYRLSLRYLELGETMKERISGYDIVASELDALAEKSGELAQFATHEHGQVVYLYKTSGENAVQTASSIGKREYMHRVSLGKAMLASMPDDRVDEIVETHGLPTSTENTISTLEELHEDLATIRDRGYAFDEEEKIKGVRCAAVPIKSNGEIFGAISVSGPSTRMEGEWYREELPNMLTRSANVIEINTKFA
ncbi:MAG: IclR family transcriptional regulator [Halobacteriota archaeon]|uniref:IclR family transcriptional regulator n=1 Tax=Natronomonas sp. TaxID=2184060 RepID=UPI003976F2A2